MSAELQRLRELLAVADADSQQQIADRVGQVENRLDGLPVSLPGVIDAAEQQGSALSTALRQPLQRSLEQLARERRELLAEAIFPVIGPAIRRAITEALRELVLNLNRLLESAFTLRGMRWRLQAWRSGVPYAQVALRELLRYSVDHLFLVQNGSGLLLASARQLHAGNERDTDAVAAMLTAIRDFARDAGLAPGDAELSEVTLGEHLLRLYPGPQAYLAAAISGVPGESLDASLADLLERTHLHHEAQLRAGEPTADLQTLLEQWLQGSGHSQQIDADRPQRRPWMGLLVVVAVALLLAVWAGERVWTGWQAERLQQALQAQPGYQVSVQRSGWRRLQVSGLRDPLAADAQAIAADSGWDGPLEWQTRPYLSLDDALQLTRLQKALQPPATVQLSLHEGRLQLRGQASAEWIAEARASLRSWPGLQGVVDELRAPEPVPAPAAPLEWEIRFDPAATVSAADAELDAVAEAWQADPARPLRIVAETDGVGDSARNGQLAQARADWVRAELLARGVAEAALKSVLVRPEVVPGRDASHRRVVLYLGVAEPPP